MVISPWWTVALAVPVLVLGELLVRRSRLLSQLFIPPAVAGGLLVAVLVALVNLSSGKSITFATDVSARWWTWLCTAEAEWVSAPAINVNSPFILAFFACLGLNGSWATIKRSGMPAAMFLALAGGFAVVQNLVGIGMAKLLDLPPLLGLVYGSVALTGGHITALGFAADLEKAGITNALNTSMATATCGIVASAVVGGIVASMLIYRRRLRPAVVDTQSAPTHSAADGLLSDLRSLFIYGRPFLLHLLQSAQAGILADLRQIGRYGKPLLLHLLLVLFCLKAGSWINWMVQSHVTFPVYIGAIMFGFGVRNALDAAGAKWIREDILHALTSVALGLFMTSAMMSLNLLEVSHSVTPMFLILGVQVIVMALFAWFVTFRLMGRDYDAAVMASGHIGFGLGETPNALANMRAIEEIFGPAPRAFLVVALVVNLFVKLINAANISVFLKFLHS